MSGYVGVLEYKEPTLYLITGRNTGYRCRAVDGAWFAPRNPWNNLSAGGAERGQSGRPHEPHHVPPRAI